MKLFTIGYEKRALTDFLEILSSNAVDIVIDIRAVAFSRRKEYSKKNLAASLKEAGIDYVHMVELGSPKELRDKVKADENYDDFFAAYKKYLRSQPEAIKRLFALARENTGCLLCYENDANRCHRRAVAERIAKKSKSVTEIGHL